MLGTHPKPIAVIQSPQEFEFPFSEFIILVVVVKEFEKNAKSQIVLKSPNPKPFDELRI